MITMNDWDKIKEQQTALIQTLHEELGWFNEEELKETPRRVTDFYKEWVGNNDFNFTTFSTDSANGLVLVKDINFYSMCAHHMLPFFGKMHIAYLQRDKGDLVGISKLPRSAIKFASQPQQQEKLSKQIVEYLDEQLKPWFVMVVIEATHLCMVMRGVKQSNPITTTSEVRWDQEHFTLDQMERIKDEVMHLIYH